LEIGGLQLIGPQLNFKFYGILNPYKIGRLFFHTGLNYYFGLNEISKPNAGLYGEIALRWRLDKIGGGGF
jgi:hypothetical protein